MQGQRASFRAAQDDIPCFQVTGGDLAKDDHVICFYKRFHAGAGDPDPKIISARQNIRKQRVCNTFKQRIR